MIRGDNNRFFYRVCLTTECGSDLEQSSIESEDDSLSIGARIMSWNRS